MKMAYPGCDYRFELIPDLNQKPRFIPVPEFIYKFVKIPPERILPVVIKFTEFFNSVRMSLLFNRFQQIIHTVHLECL